MDDERTYTVGQLARAAGVTVRALHHYDELGLLVPDRRSGGHRRYGPAHVERLFRILALRRLGFPLEAIGTALDGEGDLRALIDRQLAALEEERALRERLRIRLLAVRDAVARVPGASGTDQMIDAMEAMMELEKYYTPEQLDQLRERGEQVGQERIRAVEREWVELAEAAEAERVAGTDPGDERVQALVRKADELIAEFTGGDPGIHAALGRMWQDMGPEKASQGMIKPEVFAYLQAAREAR